MTRHGARCWALWLGVLLAAALSLAVPAYSLGPIYSFDSNAVEPISFIEDGANAPEPPARSDEQAAPLFGMDTEPLFGGDILEKWNRAKAGKRMGWDCERASHAGRSLGLRLSAPRPEFSARLR
jgi:hypothetical protein